MVLNWARGFKRIWYFILGLVWLVTVMAGIEKGAAQLGEYIAYLLVFSLGWLLLGAALMWVARGFSKSS